jgi:hypothetical protein
MTSRPTDAAVAAVIATYPADIQPRVLAIRALILRTAEENPTVGPLTETLRWGQPSYLPTTPRIGTTIRLGWDQRHPHTYSMYVHCQTSLVDAFGTWHPHVFDLIDNREIRFNADQAVPTDELGHCIELALTYHLARRSAGNPAAQQRQKRK